jgi:hypothetical protein
MDPALRRLVVARAGNRCEYCRIHQDRDPFYTFHIEHVIARQHGGVSDDGNLALACHHCNLHKGPNLSGIDPDTGVINTLFHPRQQRWSEHFLLADAVIRGLTPTGRASVVVLAMNAPIRLELRTELRSNGETV